MILIFCYHKLEKIGKENVIRNNLIGMYKASNVVFQNKENGFTVARVSANNELVTVVGRLSSIYQGQEIGMTNIPITDVNDYDDVEVIRL